MAHAYTNISTGVSLSGVAKTFIANAKSAFARQSAYARTYKELSRLTDRELEDIGIHRGMILEISQAEADKI